MRELFINEVITTDREIDHEGRRGRRQGMAVCWFMGDFWELEGR